MTPGPFVRAPLAALLFAIPAAAPAQQVLHEDFTGAAASHDWQPFLGACLTAGDGSGSIPACDGHPYYGETLVGGYNGALPDPPGNGALRFTNGSPGGLAQAGAVISGFTFPTAQGLKVTFTTVTYRGNAGGAAHDGADGISFFLTDGGEAPFDVGAFGGSLGYSCSNVNLDSKLHPNGTPRGYDGLAHAYLGLGIDEYGNFLNQGDNTAAGFGYQPGRIGLRGAGSVAFAELASRYPRNYPPALLSDPQRAQATQNTCRTGTIWDYSTPAAPVNTGAPLPDYAPIEGAAKILPTTLQIANEAAMTRGAAAPITYLLTITPAGLLSFSFSYNGGASQPVITAQSLTQSNGPLPSSFRFGFAGSSGGSSNIHEVTCFEAEPAETAPGPAGMDELPPAQLPSGTQVYLADHDPGRWTGSLTAQALVIDPATHLVSLSPLASWDGACVLTGIAADSACPSSGASGPVAAEAPSSRAILTWNGASGVPFEFTSLSSSQQSTLDAGDPAPINADRVNYLRGDRANELTARGAGRFRARASVLGDIIDSSPTRVGAPALQYPPAWTDRIGAGGAFPENAGPSYAAFQRVAAMRPEVVYVGANDGLLHGFRAGPSGPASAPATPAPTPGDGAEVLAYLPNAVLGAIHNAANPLLDYSSPQYGHAYYVDASPGSGDLYYRGAWHSWLVGGLGPGGAAIYALDITDPTRFAQANAAELVIGEWTPATLSCVGHLACGANLGNTYGVPQVRRLHNGTWGVVFGNGLGTASGAAGLFVMSLDPASGAPSFHWLPATQNSAGNGIAYTTPADLDGDHLVDYVYAGDVHGHVWRFDLTSSNPADWGVSPGGPLFTTPGGQPITTPLVVTMAPAANGGLPRLLIDFGTGRETPLGSTAPAGYAEGTQSLYGLWDWNLAGWNAKGSVQYASLAAPQAVTVAQLAPQTVLASVPASAGFRALSSEPVCWKGSTACAAGNTQFGWRLDLPGASEQVLQSPVLEAGALLVNTTIPAVRDPFNCTGATAAGWTLALSPLTGGALATSFLGDASGHFASYHGERVSGVGLNGTGSVAVLTTNGPVTGRFLVTQTTAGTGVALPVNPPALASGRRLTWVQKR